jgi:hypothetical protein
MKERLLQRVPAGKGGLSFPSYLAFSRTAFITGGAGPTSAPPHAAKPPSSSRPNSERKQSSAAATLSPSPGR